MDLIGKQFQAYGKGTICTIEPIPGNEHVVNVTWPERDQTVKVPYPIEIVSKYLEDGTWVEVVPRGVE